jgi:antitoxin ParD1/3/4
MAILANPWRKCYDQIMPSEPQVVTMNVSLPQPLKQYVDRRVSSGIYGSASEFVREAIREKLDRDRDRQDARDALTTKLLEGLDSGTPVPFKRGHFDRKKAALIRSSGRRNSRP